MADAVLTDSLRLLCALLHRHYGKKAILLIDEYDVPLDKAQQSGYYDEMVCPIYSLQYSFSLLIARPSKSRESHPYSKKYCSIFIFRDLPNRLGRTGEKMYEERLMAEEGMQETANKMISIGKPIQFDEERFDTASGMVMK